MRHKLLQKLLIIGLGFSALASAVEIRLGESENPIKVDGKISSGEYAGGISLYGMISDKNNEVTFRKSEVAIARDKEALYLAMSSELYSNIKASAADIAEFAVTAPNGKTVNVQLNAIGGGKIPAAVKQWKTDSSARNFSAEVALPWTLFGTKPVNGALWKVKLVRHWHLPAEKGVLASNIVLDDAAPGINQTHGYTGPTHGGAPQLLWKVKNNSASTQNVKCDAQIVWIGNPELVQSEAAISAGKQHTFALITSGAESDSRTVTMKLTGNGKTFLQRNYTWSLKGLQWDDPNPHIGYSIGTYPTLKKAKARIYCSKPEKLAPYASVHFQIVSLDGKKVFYDKTAEKFKDRFHLEWDIKELPFGDYKMLAVMYGRNGKILNTMQTTFEYRSFPWVDNKIGLERVIVPPFKPLTVNGNQVNATLTGYELGGEGILSKVFAKGENILTAPVTLKLNGKILQTGAVKFHEKSSDRVQASAVMDSPETSIDLDYDIDYDGFILLKMKFRPKNGNFRSMILDIPYKKAYTELLHSVSAQLRRNPSVKLDQKTGPVWNSIQNAPAYFRPYIWIGGIEKGFGWLCESEKNWSLDRSKPMAEVIRSANGDAVLRIHIVNKPAIRKNTFEIEMGFQASPVKPMMPNYRKYSTVNVNGIVPDKSDPTTSYIGPYMYGLDTTWDRGAGFQPHGKDYSFIEYLTRSSRGDSDSEINQKVDEFIRKNNITHNAKTLRAHMSHGARNQVRQSKRSIVYINPRCSARQWPEFGTYQCEWRNDAFRTGNSGLYFQNPVKSYRDYLLPQIRELVRHGFEGVYFDNTYDTVNEDEVMGPVVEYETGRYRYHHSMLEMRRLIKRTATMLYTENKMLEGRPFLTVHMTNSAPLPVLSFATYQIDWEAYFGDSDYQDRFSEGYILSTSTGLQAGCAPLICLDSGKNIERNQQTALALLLPYDLLNYWECHKGLTAPFITAINAVRNFGYAEQDSKVYSCYDPANPLKITGKAKAALVLRGREALIMAGDFGCNGSFKCDITRLGYENPVALDALTGEKIGEGNVLTVSIPHHFSRLIVVGDGNAAAEAGLSRCTPAIGKIRQLQSGNYTPKKLFHFFADKPQAFKQNSEKIKYTLEKLPIAYSFVLWAKPEKGGTGGTLISMNAHYNFISYVEKAIKYNFVCYDKNGQYRDVGGYKWYSYPGKWCFIVGTVNPVSGEITMYLNGKKAAQSVSKKPFDPVKEIFIAGRAGYAAAFCGELGDVRMYDMPLREEDVERLYKEESAKYQEK